MMWVMDKYEIRRRNLQRLINKYCGGVTAIMADKTGIAPSSLSRMLYEPGKKGKKNIGEMTRDKIIMAFSLPVDAMDSPSGENIPLPDVAANISMLLVPLVSWVQAGTWEDVVDTFEPGDAAEWMPCPVNHSEKTFALEVIGDSMTSPYPGQKSYPHGTIIFIDPERSPNIGDRVIAKLEDSNQATFKVLAEDSGQRFLKPINPQYPNIHVNGNCHIVGVVIGSFVKE